MKVFLYFVQATRKRENKGQKCALLTFIVNSKVCWGKIEEKCFCLTSTTGISEVPESKYRLVLSLLCLDKASELEVEFPTVSYILGGEIEPKKKKAKNDALVS